MHNMAEQKNIPAPESGQDAAKPAGIGEYVLIHADSVTIFPGAAPDATRNDRKNPRSGFRSGVCWK